MSCFCLVLFAASLAAIANVLCHKAEAKISTVEVCSVEVRSNKGGELLTNSHYVICFSNDDSFTWQGEGGI